MLNKNKLWIKLYLVIFLIIIVVFGGTYFLNNYFLSKYYVYRVKSNVEGVYNESKNLSVQEFMKKEKSIEEKNNVTIINLQSNELNNIDNLNSQIQLELNKSKVNINKLWITNSDVETMRKEGYVNKIFYQNKLQSNYFIKMFQKDNKLIVIGESMANDIQTIDIINKFNLYVISIAIILSIFLVWIFTRKTIKSIERLKSQAENIGSLNFKSEEIKTGDEIEELSKTLNSMSKRLEKAHMELERKNEDLKVLLSSISHEVKTPLSLIKAYAIAINDGLDDGSFSGIIIDQVDNTTKLVENILELSRAQRTGAEGENFDLVNLIDSILLKFEIQLKNKEINLKKQISGDNRIFADKEGCEIILTNFISNSIKYNISNYINIEINNGFFSIENLQEGINKENLENIWKPFYVGEKSRSKELSGTGIGLSIVEEILKREKLEYGVCLDEQKIKFFVDFKKEK